MTPLRLFAAALAAFLAGALLAVAADANPAETMTRFLDAWNAEAHR